MIDLSTGIGNDDFIDPYVKTIKRRHRYELLLKRYVQGIGLGTKRTKGIDTGVPCIIVYVYPKLPERNLMKSEKIPPIIDDVFTDVIEMEPSKPKVRTTTKSVDPRRTKRRRPAPGGVSVGHYQLKGAGTLGCWRKHPKTGEPLLESCWHILTNYGKAQKGDPILQPAIIDGGTVKNDTIAYLYSWIDVHMLGPNLGETKSNLKYLIDTGKKLPINHVDIAWAKPVSDDVVSYEILDLGIPKETNSSQNLQAKGIGTRVIKSGRTTGVTSGRISTVDVDIFIGYPTGVALFLDVICIN